MDMSVMVYGAMIVGAAFAFSIAALALALRK